MEIWGVASLATVKSEKWSWDSQAPKPMGKFHRDQFRPVGYLQNRGDGKGNVCWIQV